MSSYRPQIFSCVALCALLATLLSGCPAAENVLLLEVTSQADVDTLGVDVIDAEGHRVGQLNVRVGRTRDDINNNEPIRLVVPVTSPGAVTVFVRGRSPAGAGGVALLATRCYMVSGVLRDDVLLVQIDGTLDADGDGFPLQANVTCRDLGDGGAPIVCDQGMCPDTTAADCDDGDPNRFPGNDTICMNGIDENCRNDGLTDSDDEPCGDFDGDGWAACAGGAAPGTCDCADDNALRNPDIDESETGMLCNDGIDQDCDGRDTLCDLDGDGYGANVLLGGAPDCDDSNRDINPGAAEICDGVDNNCNRLVDENPECTPDDLDRDGYDRCPSVGTPDCTTCDCDDCNGAVHPGARPLCDGLDQITGAVIPATGDPFPDCPGDLDGDGQVEPRDCAEGNPLVYTGAPENCLTTEIEGCVASGVCSGSDTDMDGYVDAEDCDLASNDGAANALLNPAATEVCDGVDNDCDGFVNERTAAQAGTGCMFDGVGATAREVNFFAAEGDLLHCGGCALACNTGPLTVANACLAGVCDCTDEPGLGACMETEMCCGGASPGCSDLQTDHENCGSCGTVCGAPSSSNPTCIAGDCVCPATGSVCGAGAPNCCGAGCTDLSNDPANCGRCGHSCGPNATCSAGVCSCSNADRFDCNGDLNRPDVDMSDGCEQDISLNTSCGSCGNNCNTANVATSSCGGAPGARSCVINTCTGGFANCDSNTANGCEINLNALTTCGTSCSTTNCTTLPNVTATRCVSGACVVDTCSSSFGDCSTGAGCETPLWVPTACGTTCGGRSNCDALPNVAVTTCPSGACAVSSCDPGWGNCSGGAADGCETNLTLNTSCGGACPGVNCTALPHVGTTGCSASSCTISSCAAGWGNCSGGVADGCETNLTSTTSCGSACPGTNCTALPNVATTGCSSGTCTISTCSPGRGNCNGSVGDGCETNLTSNTTCGASCPGTNCTALPNVATTGCSSGTCTISTCSPGRGNCNGSVGDGCETDLTSTTTCGATCPGTNCTALPNVATVGCSSGACTITTCDPGRGNCNGNAGDGCETNLNLNTSCGTACPATDCTALPNVATTGCSSGACTITACDPGFDDCDGDATNGCEADLTSTMTCRACGTVCSGSDMCCPTGMACRPACG